MSVKEFREKVNLLIYDKKPKVLAVLTGLNIFVSLVALSVLVYFYGFRLTPFLKDLCFTILEISFAFYIFRFLVKVFFDFHPPTFIKSNWLEASVIGLLLIEGVSYNVFGSQLIEPVFRSLGFADFGDFSMIFIQLFIFLLINVGG